MIHKILLFSLAGAFAVSAASAQTPAAPASAPDQRPAQTAGRGGSRVGTEGDADPGVHFIIITDNPDVRVLQVTLQPGAVRRPHVHNDVTFHMMVPVTGYSGAHGREPDDDRRAGAGLLHEEGTGARLHEQDGGPGSGGGALHQAARRRGCGRCARRSRKSAGRAAGAIAFGGCRYLAAAAGFPSASNSSTGPRLRSGSSILELSPTATICSLESSRYFLAVVCTCAGVTAMMRSE